LINRNIPVPLYYQLQQLIKKSIETGELKPGDVLPTEMELMQKHKISRATVRQAILQLVNEGYLTRIKSKGTFVALPPEKTRFIGSLKGFAQEMRQKGVPFFTKVLESRITSSPNKVSERLQITSGDPVFFLKRLRFVQNDPVLIVEGYVPSRLCPGIEKERFEDISLYDVLESRYGIVLHHGRREFEPVMPVDSEEAALLKIHLRTPILYIESVVYTRENLPVEYVEVKIKGKFAVDLLQTGEGLAEAKKQ
jgi:GntR family transcriptional regulator